MMAYDIEVDQSGRTDRLNENTALAFSDGIQFSLLITAAVKRECYHKLRERNLPNRKGITRARFGVADVAAKAKGEQKSKRRGSVEGLLRQNAKVR